MDDFKKYTKIAALLAKTIQGQLTETEEKLLKEWRNENPQNELSFQKVTHPEFIFSKSNQFKQIDLAKAFFKIKAKQIKRSRIHAWKKSIYIAASICLLLTIALLSIHLYKDEKQIELISQESISPGNIKAELILAEGDRIILDDSTPSSILQKAGLELQPPISKNNHIEKEKTVETNLYNILQVPSGGEYAVTLQDGTKIQLNSASVLRYPVRFTGSKRKVFLTGEAYFQVAKDKKHPFIVKTGELEIEVLGTSFNVYSYTDEEHIATTLIEGSVRISSPHQTVILNPGEQGITDRNGILSKKKVDVYPYIAWKDGKFIFRKQSLEQVMRIISRWYNVDIIFQNEALKEISFTGNLKRYDDFQHILDMLSMTGNLEFHINGKTIYITGK